MRDDGGRHAHTLTRQQVIALLEERDTLREENEQLRRRVEELVSPAAAAPPHAWRLSRHEALLVQALAKVSPGVLHTERAMLALYGMFDDDTPDPKIIRTYMFSIRRKLMEAQAQIRIETVWGRGYRFDPENLSRFRAAVERENEGAWHPGQRLEIHPSPMGRL